MNKWRMFLVLLPLVACSPVVASSTATALPPDKALFYDAVAGFSFLYPKGATVNYLEALGTQRIDLPFQPGTNLQEKYLEVHTAAYEGGCNFQIDAEVSEIEFNGIQFQSQGGSSAGAGNYYDWERYTANNGVHCVGLFFVFHSTNPSNYDQPPPIFDMEAEHAIIDQIVSTFAWLNNGELK